MCLICFINALWLRKHLLMMLAELVLPMPGGPLRRMAFLERSLGLPRPLTSAACSCRRWTPSLHPTKMERAALTVALACAMPAPRKDEKCRFYSCTGLCNECNSLITASLCKLFPCVLSPLLSPQRDCSLHVKTTIGLTGVSSMYKVFKPEKADKKTPCTKQQQLT